MNDLVVLAPPEPDPLPEAVISALEEIAARHRAAGGLLLKLVNAAGGQIENRLELLPDSVKNRLEAAAFKALDVAYRTAGKSHHRALPAGDRAHLAMATLTGAVGGAAGLASSLAELPITTTMILRSIQSIAAGHGFDPADPLVRAECLATFAAGSPLPKDDGANTSFVTARITLSGPAIQRLIATIAPRFAALIGQKLAAQAVPVIGAFTGAGINYTFMDYFQEMAHVRFGLMRLGQTNDPERIAEAFRLAAESPMIKQA